MTNQLDPLQPCDYMRKSDTMPGLFDGMLKPLSVEIKRDIAEIEQHLLSCPESGPDEKQAFNRLMAELHVTSASSAASLESSHRFHCEMNAIDKAMDDAGIPRRATIDRVALALKCDDILSVTRLHNPDGWAVLMVDRRDRHHSHHYIDPGLTMAGAITRARGNA